MLSDIQKKLEVPKNQYNSFGKYHYRSCEDILTAVKPLLPKGYSLVVGDDMVVAGDRFYIKATAAILDENNKEIIAISAFAREPESQKGMNEAQITGSASSYARKYALNGLFAIDDTKDADTTNDHKGNEKSKTKKSSETSESGKGFSKTLKEDHEMLVEMYGEEEKEYSQGLQVLTKWVNKDNNEVAGLKSLKNIKSESQARVIHGKIKDAHTDWKKLMEGESEEDVPNGFAQSEEDIPY